jgi:hypothetical protein
MEPITFWAAMLVLLDEDFVSAHQIMAVPTDISWLQFDSPVVLVDDASDVPPDFMVLDYALNIIHDARLRGYGTTMSRGDVMEFGLSKINNLEKQRQDPNSFRKRTITAYV